MKWYKHDTTSFDDIRIKTLRKKYGVEGYGIYTAIVEFICKSVESTNFDSWGFLDPFYTDETLAIELNVEVSHITEVKNYMVNVLGLFEYKSGNLFWSGITKVLDEYADKVLKSMKRKTQIEIVSGVSPDVLPTESVDSIDSVESLSDRREEKREEKNRKEKNRKDLNGPKGPNRSSDSKIDNFEKLRVKMNEIKEKQQ